MLLRMSSLFLRTLRDDPADAEVPSHRLLVRAGYVRRVAPDGAVTTVAGDGTAGYMDGDPLMAQFYGLEGLGISTDGAILYLPDGNRGSEDPYHRVRRILLR